MSLKILATADIHIGRRPSKVPDLRDAERFSCARMWEAIVDRAILDEVDVLALVGDIVDHDNRFFEATGPLERGLARLADRGIPTYAVAGNHDYDVLPRIADTIGSEHFHLLGRSGRWEEAVLERGDGRRLRIHGWSFPANHVSTSPLSDYRLARDGEVPTLGLLHADLNAPESNFAPVTVAELQSHSISFWLLGHVHAPQLHQTGTGPDVLYPGSPQAMDPGETGRHGPWLIEIQGPHRARATPLGMSKVRYDKLEVDLTGAGSQEEFQSRVSTSVGDHLSSMAAEQGPLELVSLRLELAGRTALCGRIAGYTGSLQEQYERTLQRVTARVDTVADRTRPEIDLDALAEKSDPPGVLARTLRQLESGQADD
ncbi:MAG: DNA repair exonuclease, partial [Planctomycetota bacterium]